ncbi:MAG: Superoxide dismutase (Cu-Zn) precursor [Syntrophorhabdaceae bacterium PtaU1.Bin034]|nr:MAG: Superoxide dismutase (Cu-Zn) precursor [Syntrophorhabdaceae bacterium PtaU1.Bin034]
MGRAVLIVSVMSLFLMFSSEAGIGQTAGESDRPGVEKAVAVIHPTPGNAVRGVVKFTKEKAGVKVVADIEGLKEGKHGFHVHEYGDCSSMDAESAGGHFNPNGKPHGAPTDKERHVGDLGNINANAEGKAHYEWTDTQISLAGPNSIIGRAVIVHADPDDLKSQPTGNAGARLGCGVVGIAKK